MNKNNIEEMLIKRRQLESDAEKYKHEFEAMQEKNARNGGANMGGTSFFVSFSDIISVLLCFFILFFAMGKLDSNKVKKLLSTFSEANVKVKKFNAYMSATDFEMLEKVKLIVKDNVDVESIIEGKTRIIEHVISGSDLFPPGETEISDDGVFLLKEKIQPDLDSNVAQIIIEGHTDDTELVAFPEALNKYKNNLEFSSVRAGNVAKIILKEYEELKKYIGIRAYGANRPLKPNTTDALRAINRRVVIKILKEKNRKI